MWKWILGSLGAIGAVAGVAYAARTRNEENSKVTTQQPALAPASTRYWQVFELADVPGLEAAEAERRQQARALHIEALARILASEAGTQSRAVKRAVAWIARNRSISMRRPMRDMAAPDGQWGPITATRPMASTQPATDETLAIATAVLDAPQAEDAAAGATHGFDTSLQDRLAEQGLAKNNAAAVIRIWEDFYGLKKVGNIETWVMYR